jgi:hypothetical protein
VRPSYAMCDRNLISHDSQSHISKVPIKLRIAQIFSYPALVLNLPSKTFIKAFATSNPQPLYPPKHKSSTASMQFITFLVALFMAASFVSAAPGSHGLETYEIMDKMVAKLIEEQQQNTGKKLDDPDKVQCGWVQSSGESFSLLT